MAAAYVRAVDAIGTNSMTLGAQTLRSAVRPGGALLIIETTEKMPPDAVGRASPGLWDEQRGLHDSRAASRRSERNRHR